MPPERHRPRQDPVSCDSCRKKKLKCNREQPCSNCVGRDIVCLFHGHPVSTQASISTVPDITDSDLRIEYATMKARLQRLEEVVLNEFTISSSGGNKLIAPSPATTTTSVTSRTDPEYAEIYRGDFHWLDNVGTRENTRLPQSSKTFTFRVETCENISRNISHNSLPQYFVLLPQEIQALQMFEVYIDHLDPFQHIIHTPSVQKSIERLYQRLNENQRVEANEAILLLSIIATIGVYWPKSALSEPMFDTADSAPQVSMYMLRTVLDILDHVQRSAAATLETVQATIVILSILYHIEGHSPKVRSLNAAAISTAKGLGLHRTDSLEEPTSGLSQSEIIDKEIRRRVWWWLVATDWCLAIAGGPHEGTYTIQPKHMKVKKPRNISDKELATQPPDFDQPSTVPTLVSYLLQRIRIGETCRHVADFACNMDLGEIAVENVRLLDGEFKQLINKLPQFFQMGEDGSSPLETDLKHSSTVLQRYMSNLTIQARRCKFNLPFLLKASYDDRYNFAREACLDAARSALRAKSGLLREHPFSWLTNASPCGFLQFYFYATVVLVMDLCVNRAADADEEEKRKKEVREAVKTIEEAKNQTVAAGMFLNSLMAILRKHRIHLHNQEQVAGTDGATAINLPENSDSLIASPTYPHSSGALDDSQKFENLDFDQLWQSYIDLGSNIDLQNWDDLISDLATRMD